MFRRNVVFFSILMLFVVSVSAGSFRDGRDGKSYATVEIGGQTWMAENLNFRIKNSWCYDDDAGNCMQYGRLYTWEAAVDACPDGWRLPNNEDFEQLKGFAEQQFGSGMAGIALKSRRFGFNMRLGGDKVAGNYKFLGETAYLWSADDDGDSRAYDWVVAANSDNFVMGNIKFALKKNGFSVRCIQESEQLSSSTAQESWGSEKLMDSRDGKSYKMVKIGNQVWMAENLAFKTSSSRCKDNKSSNCKKYGFYYTWDEAQRVCPEGTHLPSKEEWRELWNFANNDKSSLVSEKEIMVFSDCGYCGTGCAGICYDEEARREAYGRISEDACMERCAAGQKQVTRTRPSNSTGFSALLNGVSNWTDAEGWGSESIFAYWNSSDDRCAEYSYECCPGPESGVLFSTDALSDDVDGCEEGTLEKIKSSYYPVRCILD